MSRPNPKSKIQNPKFQASTRRDLSPAQWRRFGLLLGALGLLLVAIVVLAVLVAFGELSLG